MLTVALDSRAKCFSQLVYLILHLNYVFKSLVRMLFLLIDSHIERLIVDNNLCLPYRHHVKHLEYVFPFHRALNLL